MDETAWPPDSYEQMRAALAEALGVTDDPDRHWTFLVEQVWALRQRADA